MEDLLAWREVDRDFYDKELGSWLPSKLFDAHTHVKRDQDCPQLTEELIQSNWANAVSYPQYLAEDMEADYEKLFPQSEVFRLHFGPVSKGTNIETANAYSASVADGKQSWALAVLDPNWSQEHLRDVLVQGKFCGVKPYWGLTGKPEAEVALEEMLPEQHVEVLDELGLMATVHVPGAERLRDKHTLEVLQRWNQQYRKARLVIAHLGRSYCLPFAEAAFPELVEADRILFDCCAVLNPDVFELAFRVLGPKRILWGTDFPVLSRMRGYRVWEGETYRNIVSGDFPWNKDRQPPEVEADFTYFIYEALKGLRIGAERAGLTQDEVDSVLFDNAWRLIPPLVAR